jgi:hypothetical protein
MWIAVGAWALWAGAGALAQPPPSPAGGSLEPPRFQEAPVSADTVKKVKQGMTEDPFDKEAPAKPAPAPASSSATGTSTAEPASEPVVTPRAAGDAGAPSATPPTAKPTPPAKAPIAPAPASSAEPSAAVPPAAPAPSVAAPAPATPTAPPPAPRGTPPADTKAPPRTDARTTGAQLAPVSPSQYEDLQPGPEPTVASRAPEPTYQAGPGIALQVGGGIMNFGSPQMQSVTRAGGYWDARVVLGLRTFLALELAYVGTANPVLPPAVETGGTLVGHGAEGDLRLNIPFLSRDGAYVLPYGLAGVGWQRYRITGGDSTGVLAAGDDVLSVPVGGGLTIGYRHLYFDSRFTYRFTRYEDMIPGNQRGADQLRHWAFGGNFGYVF